MKECPSCGTPNDDSAAFCKGCGKQYTREPEAEASRPVEPPPGPAPLPPPPVPGPPGPPLPPPYPPSGIAAGMPKGFGYVPEGPPEGPIVYAGFWIRFLAIIIDGCIVGAVFGAPFRLVTTHNAEAIAAVAGLVYFAAWLTYFILMTGWRGQTVGKMVLRLKVYNQDMSNVDYGTAAAREFSKILSAIILYIGFIMAGFDNRKRALHDRIAKTYVIKY
ncbi:MAG: RDD family protein [Candidatus Geothermincolia bacterium]